MNEIIKIDHDVISIGMMDGSVQEVNISALDFVPEVGDGVNVYSSENELFVRKVQDPAYLAGLYDSDEEGEYLVTRDSSGIYNIDEYLYNEVPGKAVVNKWIYSVMAIMFGGFGIHKFYSKQIRKGFLYLAFFWTGIPFVIGFIEGIIGMTKESDLDGNILV